MAKTLIEVRDLKKYFSVSAGTLHAVDNTLRGEALLKAINSYN